MTLLDEPPVGATLIVLTAFAMLLAGAQTDWTTPGNMMQVLTAAIAVIFLILVGVYAK